MSPNSGWRGADFWLSLVVDGVSTVPRRKNKNNKLEFWAV